MKTKKFTGGLGAGLGWRGEAGKVQGLWDFVRSSVKPCLVEKGVMMEMLKGDIN